MVLVKFVAYPTAEAGELRTEAFSLHCDAQYLEPPFCMCLTFDARIIQLKSSSHEIPHTLLGKVVITAGNIPWSYVYKGHLDGEQTQTVLPGNPRRFESARQQEQTERVCPVLLTLQNCTLWIIISPLRAASLSCLYFTANHSSLLGV